MSGLPIECPACHTRYLLPPTLLGEGGAEVRCPSCGREFAVDAGGGIIGASEDLRALARAVFDELGERLGPELARAAAERRLFADHGPAILGAWDEFRRRGGAHVPARPFRDELRQRFGVELSPPGAD